MCATVCMCVCECYVHIALFCIARQEILCLFRLLLSFHFSIENHAKSLCKNENGKIVNRNGTNNLFVICDGCFHLSACVCVCLSSSCAPFHPISLDLCVLSHMTLLLIPFVARGILIPYDVHCVAVRHIPIAFLSLFFVQMCVASMRMGSAKGWRVCIAHKPFKFRFSNTVNICILKNLRRMNNTWLDFPNRSIWCTCLK